MPSIVANIGKMYIKEGGAWSHKVRGEAFLKQSGAQATMDNIFLRNAGTWYPMFPMIAAARWGLAPFAGTDLLQSGAASVQAFIDDNLTNEMSGHADGEQFTFALPDASTYAYFAVPAIMNEASFLDVASSFTGGWDGATWSLDPFSDGSFMNTGPITVQYDGGRGTEDFYVYRTDYPGTAASKAWAVSYPSRPAGS